MKRRKNHYIPFIFNVGCCCLMTFLFSLTGNVLFAAAAVTAFFGYSSAVIQIHRHRKVALLTK